MNEDYVRRLEKALEAQKSSKRNAALEALLKKAGGVFPKGIRSPDSAVKNIHLVPR